MKRKRACRLEGLPVRTTGGQQLGHVYDLRCQRDAAGHLHVTHIVFGRRGLLVKLGMLQHHPQEIPWPRVREWRHNVLVVEEG